MYRNGRNRFGLLPAAVRPEMDARYGGWSAEAGVTGNRLFFGQPESPPQPAFVTACPTGCPPVAAGQCVAILRQAIIEAIKLANSAAAKVEAATNTEPGKRDEEAKNTARLYTSFFGHDPSMPVSWADNNASGVSVAFRFRAVAKALQKGGRNTTFRCLVGRTDCNAFITMPAPGVVAPIPNVVNLCDSFWNPPTGLKGLPPPDFRAGIIIHEMLHLLFHEFLLHQPPGRPNAHCYEAFALRVNGFGADPVDVKACFPQPASVVTKSPLQRRLEEAWNRTHPSPSLTRPRFW